MGVGERGTQQDESDAAASDRCLRCRNATAEIELNRCIFCHVATGVQYVPIHFAHAVGREAGESNQSLPYTDALQAHCACGGCWEAWEQKQVLAGRSEVPCPICQRAVDVFRGYEGCSLCRPCLREVVPLRPRRPRTSQRKRCSCLSWPLLVCTFVGLGMVGIAVNCAVFVTMSRVISVMEPEEIATALGPLHPVFAEVVCPHLDLISIAIDSSPLAIIVREFGKKLCKAALHSRASVVRNANASYPEDRGQRQQSKDRRQEL